MTYIHNSDIDLTHEIKRLAKIINKCNDISKLSDDTNICLTRLRDLSKGDTVVSPPTIDEINRIACAVGSSMQITYMPLGQTMGTTVPIKKLCNNAALPRKGRDGDAGYDLYAVEAVIIPPRGSVLVKTGISVALPKYTVGLIWPRSGLSVKHNIETGAGVIDSNYRGDIAIKLYNHGDETYEIFQGDRVAQILVMTKLNVTFLESTELPDDSDRGENWQGSSGR